MKRKQPPANPTDNLRRLAEKFLAAAGPDRGKIPIPHAKRLVHELQVHQMELDMQNQELRRAYQEIEEARSKYIALYDFAPVGYFTLSRKGKIIQVNLTGAGLLGVERSLLIDQPFHLRLAPEFWEAFRVHLQKVFETGGQQTCELKILRPDGTPLHVLMASTTPPDAKEAQRQCHAVISDITDRKQAEQELYLKERLLDGASDSIFLHDLDGHFLYLNEAAYKDRGYGKEELLGKDLSVLVTPEFARLRESLLNDLLAKGETIFESAHRRKDGSVMPVEIHARTINLTDRQLILSVARDITERKIAEDEIKLNEARLASLLRISQYESESIQDLLDFALHEAIALTSSKIGYIYFYNDEKKQFTLNTWSKEVMTECSIVEYQTVYELEETGLWGEAVRQARPIMVNDFQGPHPLKKGYPEGLAKLYKYLTIPVFSGDRIVAVLAVANKETDYDDADLRQLTLMMDAVWKIADRQRTEEKLRSAAHKWRTTFDAIGDAVCLMDAEAKILTCNQAMADLVKRPFPEIIGRHCWDVVHGTAGPIDGCPLVRMKKSGKRETLTMPLGDRWLHTVVDPILNEAGEVTGVVHTMADITEHQRALEQIKNLNVILTAVKDMNETLLRAKSEPELFQRICDLMLEIPYNRFTWIGLVEPGSFEVKPVAWAGHEEGFLSGIKVTWDDSPYGRGPSGTAIKTGQPAIVEDIENDPGCRPWRQQALQRGYASCIAFPLIHEYKTLGSLNVYAEKKNAFRAEELGFLEQVAGDIAVGVRSLRLEQELAQRLIQLEVMMIQTIETIASMAEMRDPYTAGHQQRVTRLALALAQETGLAPDRTEGLRVASLIHDIGKMVVPTEILNKPGKISGMEMNIIRTHSQAGYDILTKIDFPWPVAQIVLQHHERLDGSGYPQGLQGADILQEAKVLAVADVVEAMASHRPYRPALGVEAALAEITKKKGILYDPKVVEVCVTLFTEKGFHFD